MKWPLLALLWLGLPSGSAGAQEDVYALEYRAEELCPSGEVFRREVGARSQKLRFGRSRRAVRIEVSSDSSGYYGARVELPSGKVRRVQARQCDDVVRAAAFIVVVALEGKVPERPAGQEQASPSEPDSKQRPPPVLSLGALGGFSGARAPTWMPTLGGFFRVESERGLLALRPGLRVLLGQSQTSLAIGNGTFTFLGANLDACPAGPGPSFFCAGLEGGVLDVKTSEELSSGDELRSWLAAKAGVGLRLVFGDAWLTELEAGMLVPLTRDRFLIQRSDGAREEIHRPGISGYGTVAIGHSL